MDPYETYEAPSEAEFNEAHTEHSTSIQTIQSNTVETVKRTHFILDLIFGVLCVLLLLFAINTFLVAVVRVAIFNESVPSVSKSSWPVELKRLVRNTRFSAASGIIGSFFALVAAVLGFVAVVLRSEKMKMARVGLTVGFLIAMVCLLFTNVLTCITASAVFFRAGGKDANSRGVAWLMIGGQFLLFFHGGIIAFAILRIVYWMKH